ncbi:hypothetical protein FOL47_003358 [Perkinsus chesapeaki]|uniref:Aquaporin-9 n=1 Tax=Perkinsus chesapeaki TaxID=330153 RepID=A0A7J6M8E8_PERCH|nr:hypothetical protein FOL47_003358 [Perkinsus chesapeaki]
MSSSGIAVDKRRSSDVSEKPFEPPPHEAPLWRKCIAELFGTVLLVGFGTGVVAQVKVDVVGNYLALSIGWACGLVFGILASVRISGAHLNPAVSLALCVSKLMPWRNLLPYIGSQILGAFIGAAITFLCYYQEMEVKDLSNAGVFATYPRPGTNAFNQIVNEMVGTALLTTAIAAVIDSKDKAPANRFHIAGFVGLALLAIGLCFGANTGYAINPARDFGPRLFTALAGWGPQVFTADNYYFWVPIVGPMLGGTIELFGTAVLITLGTGVVAQVKVCGVGNFLCITIGWACGVVFGVLASYRISGAHLNPAVSLALCVSKLMPWRNLLPYIGSQILGAFIGAAITFLCYYQEMEAKDLSNAGVFATYPRPGTNAFNQIVNEIVGTALLTTAIAAVIDSKDKAPANRFHIAGFVGLVVLAIGLCFGANTGYAINPARDFGPRLFTALAGWGSQVFTADNYYFWVPIVGPMLGGTIDIFLKTCRQSSGSSSTVAQSPSGEPPLWKKCFAEMFGTAILLAFGTGVVAQVNVCGLGNYLCIAIGWACGVTFGVLASYRISGAQLNPAVSLALCVCNLMPWRNLVPYVASQVLGAFIGACITFLCYYQDFEVKDLSNAGVFATYPRAGNNAFNSVVNEVVGSALLTAAIAAIGDTKDSAPANRFHVAGFVGLVVLTIGISFGVNTGYAINPARDFGPRLFSAMAGWGSQVFTADNYYFWVPIVGPLMGGTIGMALQRLVLR